VEYAHRLALGAADEIGIQHAALDGKSPFGQILPRMALSNGTPLDVELRQAGLQGEEHGPMITNDGIGAPHRVIA
jgi:hypothetical protein